MSKELNKEIGARLRAQREYLGLSREEVSGYIDISPQFLSEVERGVKGASAKMLYRLCEGLKISADYVLMGKENYPDTSKITNTLAMLDKKYIPLAEEMLKTFIKVVSIKQD